MHVRIAATTLTNSAYQGLYMRKRWSWKSVPGPVPRELLSRAFIRGWRAVCGIEFRHRGSGNRFAGPSAYAVDTIY